MLIQPNLKDKLTCHVVGLGAHGVEVGVELLGADLSHQRVLRAQRRFDEGAGGQRGVERPRRGAHSVARRPVLFCQIECRRGSVMQVGHPQILRLVVVCS